MKLILKGVNITNFQTMILVSKSTEITIGGGVILHEKKKFMTITEVIFCEITE